MDINGIMKAYCLKFALPVVLITLLVENMFTKDSYLG